MSKISNGDTYLGEGGIYHKSIHLCIINRKLPDFTHTIVAYLIRGFFVVGSTKMGMKKILVEENWDKG